MKGSLNVMMIIVIYPLAHILSLVPKPGSCHISRNRLICVYYLGLRGPECPQTMHMRYQHDRGNVKIILECHTPNHAYEVQT